MNNLEAQGEIERLGIDLTKSIDAGIELYHQLTAANAKVEKLRETLTILHNLVEEHISLGLADKVREIIADTEEK